MSTTIGGTPPGDDERDAPPNGGTPPLMRVHEDETRRPGDDGDVGDDDGRGCDYEDYDDEYAYAYAYATTSDGAGYAVDARTRQQVRVRI